MRVTKRQELAALRNGWPVEVAGSTRAREAPKVLTLQDVALGLGVSVHSVRGWVTRGELAGERDWLGHWTVKPEAVADYVRRRAARVAERYHESSARRYSRPESVPSPAPRAGRRLPDSDT